MNRKPPQDVDWHNEIAIYNIIKPHSYFIKTPYKKEDKKNINGKYRKERTEIYSEILTE